MESTKAVHKQVGDVCSIGDKSVKNGSLLQYLVMPAREEERVSTQSVRRLAENASKDRYVHVME